MRNNAHRERLPDANQSEQGGFLAAVNDFIETCKKVLILIAESSSDALYSLWCCFCRAVGIYTEAGVEDLNTEQAFRDRFNGDEPQNEAPGGCNDGSSVHGTSPASSGTRTEVIAANRRLLSENADLRRRNQTLEDDYEQAFRALQTTKEQLSKVKNLNQAQRKSISRLKERVTSLESMLSDESGLGDHQQPRP